MEDEMILTVPAKSENEALARVAVAAFAGRLRPTLEELDDLRTAVSEAVTNAVVHGYPDGEGMVVVRCIAVQRRIILEVTDHGVGIEDVEKAREPFFTTGSPQERSGMGFTVMEAFTDTLLVESAPGEGTTVHMEKEFSH